MQIHKTSCWLAVYTQPRMFRIMRGASRVNIGVWLHQLCEYWLRAFAFFNYTLCLRDARRTTSSVTCIRQASTRFRESDTAFNNFASTRLGNLIRAHVFFMTLDTVCNWVLFSVITCTSSLRIVYQLFIFCASPACSFSFRPS